LLKSVFPTGKTRKKREIKKPLQKNRATTKLKNTGRQEKRRTGGKTQASKKNQNKKTFKKATFKKHRGTGEKRRKGAQTKAQEKNQSKKNRFLKNNKKNSF
jgi:hypothetical protein